MTGGDTLSKAVSANITRILQDLLEDYDKTERPSYKEGKPRELREKNISRKFCKVCQVKLKLYRSYIQI